MSEHDIAEVDEGPALIANYRVDAIVAVIIFIAGAVVVMEALRLGAGWTDDGPGSGYFPFYIGLIVCISAVGVFWQSMVKKTRDTGGFVNRVQLSRVLSVIVPAVIYVFAMVFLGIYVASAIYIALFMIVLGKYSPLKSVALGVVVMVFFFLMFEVWFKVPLYKGTLDLLGFTGY
ncbi:MAG: tripartite tricarboxylate transporter TctB family protein [Pseudomonadota bacterium]|nr:tripartite tricarboxylate transporter TctB family protein [Pseudomonadota bacterium]